MQVNTKNECRQSDMWSIVKMFRIIQTVVITYNHFSYFKSCHAGWRGPNCTQCVPLVGCNATRGGCIRAMECICHEGWKGPLCGEPICSERCVLPYGRCSVCINFIVDISKRLNYSSFTLYLNICTVYIFII